VGKGRDGDSAGRESGLRHSVNCLRVPRTWRERTAESRRLEADTSQKNQLYLGDDLAVVPQFEILIVWKREEDQTCLWSF
jgi:hypothetical protein